MDIRLTIFTLVQNIMAMLVNGKYSTLVAMTRGVRLNEIQIQESISHYGKTILPLPNEALRYLDIIEIKNAKQARAWAVITPFWTLEEGRSDLSLELTVIEDKERNYIVELENIHVL